MLHSTDGKANRVSYSTSHAEALSMIGGVETTTLIMVRMAEIFHKENTLTVKHRKSLRTTVETAEMSSSW